MKVSDILRIKGGTLFTATPQEPLLSALKLMVDRDIGSLDMDEVRRMMLDRHARYMPVMNNKMLMGVISFHDVARAVVDSQNLENKLLKAYIHDWPEGQAPDNAPKL